MAEYEIGDKYNKKNLQSAIANSTKNKNNNE
jgi:hypothetical protein